MADLWRVTYMGEGVKSTTVGAFAKHVTAFVDEAFAKEVAGQQDWVVADPTGKELGAKAEPKKDAKPAEAPKDEKPKDAKPAEKKDEKAAEKK